MLNKENVTPNTIGMKSVGLAVLWRRIRELHSKAPYPPHDPALTELRALETDANRIIASVKRKHALTRLTQDQLWRDATLEEDGPSTLLVRRARTGESNPYIRGPKVPLPGPRPGEK